MRGRLFGLFLVLFLAAPALAGGVAVDVVSDDGRTVVLSFRLTDFDLRPVGEALPGYVETVIPGEASGLEAGAPALAYAARDVAIPDGEGMAVTVLSTHFRDVPARVAPSKGNLLRTVDPASVPYRFGPGYEVPGFQPSSVAALGEPFVLRERRGITVRWNPLQYEPVSGTLRIHDQTIVQVAPSGAKERSVPGPERPSRAFQSIYRARFVNEATRAARAAYPPVDEQGEMLIIAHDPWIPNLQRLVTHKAARGITATVVGVGTIGNDAASIKSYIQSYYDTHNLAFVLLVGDSDQVATPLKNFSDATDPTYAKLAGADPYPDVLVGRFSAQTEAQLETQIERTITYETQPGPAMPWFRNGVGIASAEGAGAGDEGQSDRQHMEEIRGWLEADGWAVDQIYDPGATDTMVANALNAGRGLVNYVGHGSATSWGTTGFNVADVDALVNEDKLPVIMSVACVNGEFNHYDPCFAEAWLRASKNGRPTGAAATYMSSINQSWAPPMEAQDEFNLLWTDPARPYTTFGALCFAGSSSMMSAYGQGGVDMFDTWHVFGDPSLYVASGPSAGLMVTPPDGLASSGPVGGTFSPTSKVYTLRNMNADPMDFAVAADAPWVTLSATGGTIPAHGSVTVTVGVTGASSLDLGTAAATVSFTDLTGHQGDTTRAVTVEAKGSLGLRVWSLDADPAWTRTGEWEYGVPTGQGGGGSFRPDPTAGHTGANVFGVNLNGDFNTRKAGGPFHLTAGPIDLAGLHGAALKFDRWLNTAAPPSVTATVEVSPDGVAWTTLWSASANVTDAAWTEVSLPLPAAVDGRSTVYVRWGYQVLTRIQGSTMSGWNVDDVEIWASPSTARTTLTVEPGRLDWTAMPSVPRYDVVKGDLGSLRANGGDFGASLQACAGNDLAATTLSEASIPAEGAGFWYLVRGAGLSGALTYQDLAPSQHGMRDTEIAASAAACP